MVLIYLNYSDIDEFSAGSRILNQWDYGQKICMSGIDATEAHFWIRGSDDDADVVLLTKTEEGLIADIPDKYLRQTEQVMVSFYNETVGEGETVAELRMEIRGRAKPSDYIYTPDDMTALEILVCKTRAKQGLIADFVFDRIPEDGIFRGAGAIATIHGRPGLERIEGDRAAITFYEGADAYLSVTREDGTPLLTGLSDFTISYDVISRGGFATSWVTYICPHDNPQSVRDYLGILNFADHIDVERAPEEVLSAVGGDYSIERHVDIVVRAHGVFLYVDGEYKGEMYDDTCIAELLKGNSVFYIGKANWNVGEYFHGALAGYRVYGYALSGEEIRRLAEFR